MVWLDRIGGYGAPRALSAGGELRAAGYTGFEVAVFLDWYEYLNRVAGAARVDISQARAAYLEAVSRAREMDFNAAYPKAVEAVRLARDALKRSGAALRAEADRVRGDISSILSQAQREGIDVGAFIRPLAVASAAYNSGDYIAALDLHLSIRSDVSSFVASARAGRPVGRLSGTYDIPAGTTDIITVDFLSAESVGYQQEWLASDAAVSYIRGIVKQYEPGAEVLGYRVVPPRVVIFVRSPIAPVILYIIFAAVFFIGLSAVLYFWYEGARADAQKAAEERKAYEAKLEYDKYLLGLLTEGKISKETFDKLKGESDTAFKSTVEQMERTPTGLLETLVWLIPVALVLTVIGWFVGRR
jgi:hypothetical protein